MINWAELTITNSFLGGILIGVAASVFILFNGKIAGISGIVGGLFRPKKNDFAWRVMFILGLVISPIIYNLISPLPTVTINTSKGVIVIAGVLVGLGSRFGSGCTSGHGVCGVARISPRSI
ncbi:MAG TPA: YeeE/YedE family protein, partial [Methylophilaceae bacterium]|nr:YeeE/YedE family protein [Methylophilaceae bacterium]